MVSGAGCRAHQRMVQRHHHNLNEGAFHGPAATPHLQAIMSNITDCTAETAPDATIGLLRICNEAKDLK